MATKNVAEVVIAGKILKITGYESMEYLHRVASYINGKIGDFEQLEGYRRYSGDQKQIMLYMNLADDYFKAKQLADQQTTDLGQKEKDLYGLKHDLIECQIAKEQMEITIQEKSDLVVELETKTQEQEERIQELQARIKLLQEQLEEAKESQVVPFKR